ncbi:MAG: xanthine dehydrogenase family protein subunit M [Deltaproteobacteria bacterium]|nr:xanthine dehydrogenase family protein subunit M [Deltaproteobacteria bacterium]
MVIDYFEPTTVSETVSLLAKYGDDASVIAGGQSLLVMMRQRLVSPKYLISLKKVGELNGVQEDASGNLSIGAATTHRDAFTSPVLRRGVPLLCQAASKVGSTAIRNLGTIGGNICHNELGADPPQALLALNAKAVCVGATGERTIPLEKFFTGYFETAMNPGEVLKMIEIPSPPPGTVGVYLKHALRAGDLAIVGVAVLLGLETPSKKCREIRIGLGGVASVPLRAYKAEQLLQGSVIGADVVNEAAYVAMSEVDPVSDTHGSADYRRKMVGVFLKRAIRQAADAASKPGSDV